MELVKAEKAKVDFTVKLTEEEMATVLVALNASGKDMDDLAGAMLMGDEILDVEGQFQLWKSFKEAYKANKN